MHTVTDWLAGLIFACVRINLKSPQFEPQSRREEVSGGKLTITLAWRESLLALDGRAKNLDTCIAKTMGRSGKPLTAWWNARFARQISQFTGKFSHDEIGQNQK
jgi:hypothetical protein